MKLYFAPGACSLVPHVLLERLTESHGLAFEPLIVKLHKGEHLADSFKALNPHSQVPVLVDGEAVITQILAITVYLDALHPEAQLLPQAPLARARALETLSWMNNSAHITFAHVFRPGKFLADESQHPAMQAHNRQQYREVLAELQTLAVAAGQTPSGWFAGAQPGPLDAYALVLARWGSMEGIDPAGYPQLWDFVNRLAAHPTVAKVLARERLPVNLYPQAA